MADTMPENNAPDQDTPGASTRKKVISVALFTVGVALLGSAIWAVVRQGDVISEARTAARGASPLMIAACIVLPLVNWVATSGVIWVLTCRYGRVRPTEMAALIGAAWLLNLLPLRPGMVGRVAYHKRFNGIAVADSVRALFAALVCTGCAIALLMGTVFIAARASRAGSAEPANAGGWLTAVIGFAPVVILGCAAWALRRRGHTWRWPAAIGFRYIDLVTWAVRYILVFSIIGHPIGLIGGGAMTAVGQVAMMVPVQLGLREWAVGMASTYLPAAEGFAVMEGASGGAAGGGGGEVGLIGAAGPGLLADCLMRAAELLIVVPLGLAATVWVVRRMRSNPEVKADPPTSEE